MDDETLEKLFQCLKGAFPEREDFYVEKRGGSTIAVGTYRHPTQRQFDFDVICEFGGRTLSASLEEICPGEIVIAIHSCQPLDAWEGFPSSSVSLANKKLTEINKRTGFVWRIKMINGKYWLVAYHPKGALLGDIGTRIVNLVRLAIGEGENNIPRFANYFKPS